VGEPHKVQVTYPENYSNREIAGKAVDFLVIVREIKQKVLPELDDDFAKDHGECGSLSELKEAIRRRLEDELSSVQDENLKEQIITRLIESHSFTPPPSMVDRQTRYLMERYHDRVPGRGASESEPSPTTDEIRKTLETRAARQVQATLLVEKIAELEKIEIAEKEIQERVDQLARVAGDRAKSVRELYSRPDKRDDLKAQLIFDRTLGFLLEHAQIREVDRPPSKVDDQGEKS
jgi:trigger factor